jgi:DNA protecting protein DprA
MIDLQSIDGLLFLSYLTNYNIEEIYSSLQYSEFGGFIDDFIRYKREKQQHFNLTNINKALEDSILAKEKLKYYSIEMIPFYSSKYPSQLSSLKDKPPILYVRGQLKKKKFAAIVGSRNSSKLAKETINLVSEEFIKLKYGIVSGLAIGIDTIAHNIALEKGAYTVSVLPTSLDTIYPVENFKLANDIIDRKGALISEIPIGINRGKRSFVERNRLQAALSDFVVPIEMGINSGTMHTVNYCLKQNKNLLLLRPPENMGAEYNSYYEGINHLIHRFQEKPGKNVYIIPPKEIVRLLNTRNKISVSQKRSKIQQNIFDS